MNAEHRERTGAERRRISPVGVLVVIALVLFVTILALESNEAKGKSPEELKIMADNILFEIKNGPPFVYS